MSGKIYLILLGVWFLLYGLLAVTNFTFEMQHAVMGFLAIVIAIVIAINLWNKPPQ